MEFRYSADPIRFTQMNTDEIRNNFLIDDLFNANRIDLLYSDIDRAIVGSAVPTQEPLELTAGDELRAAHFCERRELGVLNVGKLGKVTVEGQSFDLNNKDCLYIGLGSKDIRFESTDPKSPARFYLLSYPAHKKHPNTKVPKSGAMTEKLGTQSESNVRTIYKTIHPDGAKSCQLVMGFTELDGGSVWNTMPPHTHERRMEVYLYVDLEGDGRVFHMMGKPDETRHIVVANEQAVISPSWSIHSGAGTSAYTMCWGMGGENQTFSDMDHLAMSQLK